METPDGKNSEDLVRSIINVPKEYRILCMMPIGYPAEDLPEHDEKDFDKSKIHSEKW
jgi:nitroreductase